MSRVADLIVRRRRWIVVGWIAALIGLFALSGQIAGEWEADYSTPGAESEVAASILAERFADAGSGGSIDVVWQAPGGVESEPAAAQMETYLAEAAELESIVAAEEPRISADGTIAMSSLELDRREWDVPLETAEALIDRAEELSSEELRVELAGGIIQEAGEAADPEVIGLFAAMIILLIAFGSVVAAGLPLMTALFGLGAATALIGILAAVLPVPNWATAVTALIGIALGIDYTLLILTRFRAALNGGGSRRDAIAESLATAGRSVLVAGITVIIALGGLLLMRLSFMTGVAFAAMIAVLAAMFAALTLVPAVLAMAGSKIDRLRIPGFGRGAWGESGPAAARWSRAVQRRPILAASVSIVVLLALTAPMLDMRLGFPDFGSDPEGTTTRAAYDLSVEAFGAGSTGPLLVTVDFAEGQAGAAGGAADADAAPGANADAMPSLDGVADELRGLDRVAEVEGPFPAPSGDAALITVIPASSPQVRETEDLVHDLREDILPAAFDGIPGETHVGGLTASFVDQSDVMEARLPVFITGVVLISLLLLLVAFRAPLLALKAGFVNLLSVGAAYGVVSLASQGGAFGQLFGIDTETPVAPFIPVIMFAILFGLSMDYEVFLLSRVREEYLRSGDPAAAVTAGLAKTARVITAAAAIMVAVFSAFLFSPEVFLKQIGLGMAAAIAVDASIIRMVLVPALMQIMGRASWWLPPWLDRILPHVDVEHELPPRTEDRPLVPTE